MDQGKPCSRIAQTVRDLRQLSRREGTTQSLYHVVGLFLDPPLGEAARAPCSEDGLECLIVCFNATNSACMEVSKRQRVGR
jgi:hypothetical protein